MTERKAAQIANQVYAAARAKQITANEAMEYLNQLEPFMSAAQLAKFSDFSYAVRHNPSSFA
jgi:hypothetical protein